MSSDEQAEILSEILQVQQEQLDLLRSISEAVSSDNLFESELSAIRQGIDSLGEELTTSTSGPASALDSILEVLQDISLAVSDD